MELLDGPQLVASEERRVASHRDRRSWSRRSAIQEVQADFGCPVVSIICMNDIIQYLEGQPEKATFLEAMRAYRTKYGAEAEAP